MAAPKGHPKWGGRKKEIEVADVRAMAAQYTRRAIERLVFWLESDNAKASTLSAQVLLNRAHGSPAQTIIGAVLYEHRTALDAPALSGKLQSALTGRSGSDDSFPTVQ